MIERDHAHDSERLPEEAARQLLARASELEVARGAGLSVAELREAAREAGIAPGAFEQALAELREQELTAATPGPSGLRRLTRFWPAAVAAALMFAVLLSRLLP